MRNMVMMITENITNRLSPVCYGHLEKLPFGVSQTRLPRPISALQENEKCSHVTNMLRFLIFLFLDLERKF